MRSGPMSISELRVGMVLPGTVRSLTSFGAFVDIGVGQDGLLHSKQIERSQSAIVGAGSTLNVTILAVDPQRKRISLGLERQGVSAHGRGAPASNPISKSRKQTTAPSGKQRPMPSQTYQRHQRRRPPQQNQQHRKQTKTRAVSLAVGITGKSSNRGRSKVSSQSSSTSTRQVIDLTSENGSKKALADRIRVRKKTTRNSGNNDRRSRDPGVGNEMPRKSSIEERISSRKQGFKKGRSGGGTKRGREREAGHVSGLKKAKKIRRH